jgi:hypothetical protein
MSPSNKRTRITDLGRKPAFADEIKTLTNQASKNEKNLRTKIALAIVGLLALTGIFCGLRTHHFAPAVTGRRRGRFVE